MADPDEERNDPSTIIEPGKRGEPARPSKPHDLEPVPGDIIDEKYQVLQRLGAGATGLVLRCLDSSLQRQVAVKLIRRHRSDEFMRTRFLAEARALARISHPNVVDIHTYGEHLGRPYLVMEYVEGTALDQWLEARVELPSFEEALRILDKVCRGVEAIHASGRVHRDLKPGNVLIGPLRVAVADLGLAAAAGETFFAGTPAYMAPEVAGVAEGESAPATTQGDIYALGVIAYELFTGHLPRPRGQEAKKISPVPPRRLRPVLPPGVDQIVLRALAHDPAERHRSVGALRQEFLKLWRVSGPHYQPVRIMVADDDPDMAILVRDSLLEEFPGADVMMAVDGEDALAQIAERGAPALIVSDIDMPRLDGIELTRRLREQDALANTPIIIITGTGGAAEWQELNRIGADAFQVKPIDPQALADAARRVVDARRRKVTGE